MHKPRNWVEEYDPIDSLAICSEFARRHAERGGAVGKKILGLLTRCDYAALCSFKLEYGGVWNREELYHCAQALGFIQKTEWLDIGLDLRREAWDNFERTQEKNLETNTFLRDYRQGLVRIMPRVAAVIHSATRQISDILGDVPTLEELGLRFGKGGTTLTPKRSASRREKLAAGVSCSKELFPIAASLLSEMPTFTSCASVLTRTDEEGETWDSVPVRIHPGKLNLVPKKATALRLAITEPVLNGMYQMALGDEMTQSLKRWGINLKDQSRNMRLAREASVRDDHATVDLSDSSNLIAREVPFELLPPTWSEALARGRTGTVDWQGREVTVQWFSSMGNGFTFPLQTIIYHGLAKSVMDVVGFELKYKLLADDGRTSQRVLRHLEARQEVSNHDLTCLGIPDPTENWALAVYGDDIILPTACMPLLREVFVMLGFSINERKTFTTGPFRESCGGDYYLGTDVRPYFQKKLVSPRTLFALHNFYKKRGLHDDAQYVVSLIHPALRDYGPPKYGDGHLHTTSNILLRRRQHVEKGWTGYSFRTHSVVPRIDSAPRTPEQDYAYALYMAYMRASTTLFRWSLEDLLYCKVQQGIVAPRGLRIDQLNLLRHRRKGLTGYSRGYGYYEVSEASAPITSDKGVSDDFPLTEDGVSTMSTIYTLG